MRGHAGEPTHVLVVATLGAVRRSRLRRRLRSAPPTPDATPVAVGRATLIAAQPIAGDPQAWLSAADCEREAREGLAVINSVLQRQRIVAADAAAHGIAPGQALVIRVGSGLGEEVADGRWTAAVEIAPAAVRRRREAMLSPQERLAAVFSGRDVVLACEELTLRARSDVDSGRWREAAFQLDTALRAAIAELASWAGQGDIDERVAELVTASAAVGGAAKTALIGGLTAEQIGEIERSLGRLEAALRARSATAR